MTDLATSQPTQRRRLMYGTLDGPGPPVPEFKEPDPTKEKKGRVFCGALTRTGKPCANYALGNGRCRMHHGSNDAPAPQPSKEKNKHNFTHGLYADVGLLPGEEDVYHSIALGQLDDELRMKRIKLRRAYAAQARWETEKERIAQQAVGEVAQAAIDSGLYYPTEIQTEAGGVVGFDPITGQAMEVDDKTKVTRRVHDFTKEILALTRTIATLERDRKELLEQGFGEEDMVRGLANDLREFGNNAQALMPGGVELGSNGNDNGR